MTLNLIQSLYEKKITTYPRVDTTYLSDDIYPKCPQTLNGLFQTKFNGIAPYAELIKPLGGKPLTKSKKVFDSSKVTDHHAIIPTGVSPTGLTDAERNVFDLVARRFIAVFYPDCKFAQTIVTGKIEDIEFKVTGKTILDPGWHNVYAKDQQAPEEDDTKKKEEERTLPVFKKGESGSHKPTLTEKWTTPPKPYTEATLLRAMETAGRLVEDEALRAAMKENGIGRPSTRAAIIETLFKRHYIKRIRTSIAPTPTGVELIGLIREDLLKSAELTGIWEKKLRDIEFDKTNYNQEAQDFINGLKAQVTDIVNQVKSDMSNRRVTVLSDADLKKVKSPKAEAAPKPKASRKKKKEETTTAATDEPKEGDICPLCGQGHIIKGKTAYGCSRWKEGCTYRVPFKQ